MSARLSERPSPKLVWLPLILVWISERPRIVTPCPWPRARSICTPVTRDSAFGTLLSGSLPTSSATTESTICFDVRFMSLAASTLPRIPTTTIVASSVASASSETPSDSCAAAAVGTHPNATAPNAAEHRIVDLILISPSPHFCFDSLTPTIYRILSVIRAQAALRSQLLSDSSGDQRRSSVLSGIVPPAILSAGGQMDSDRARGAAPISSDGFPTWHGKAGPGERGRRPAAPPRGRHGRE